jgi:hypothetical protein
MKFDKQAMIADFLAEMAELNTKSEKPKRSDIEVEFSKLLQHNVFKGYYGQDYCNTLSSAMFTMTDEVLYDIYDEMKTRFPFLEV